MAIEQAHTTQRMSGHAARASALRSLFLLVFAACAIALALAFAPVFARPAFAASSYTCPQTDIAMQVETDGSYRATEDRIIEFSGESQPLVWAFTGLSSTASVRIDGVRMAPVDADGNVEGEWTSFRSAAFSVKWRDGGGPDDAAFAYDNAKNKLYVFPHVTDARVVVELDYTIENAAVAYKDISEVYWTYVALNWPVASENVTATISLPVPQGTVVTPGDTVRAWGHGPENGTVSVDSAGTVTLHDDVVNPGQYATAHVLFPPAWLTHLDGKKMLSNRATARLDYAVAEEKTWTDSWNFQQQSIYTAFTVMCAVCALLLIAAMAAYALFGREHVSDFAGQWYRRIPKAGLEPAIAGRLWRWNHEDMRDLTATIMRLAHKGVLSIEPVEGENPTWRISVALGAPTGELSALESAALELVMGRSAFGAALSLGDIEREALRNPQAFVDAVESWQAQLGRACDARGFFEPQGKRLQKAFLIVAGVVALAGIVCALAMGNPIPLAIALPTAIALALVANYLPRRTERGNNLVSRCKGLRNWLRELPETEERVDMDEAAWGELLPFAYQFGVAGRAVCCESAPQPREWKQWYETKSQSALARVKRRACAPAVNECLLDSLQAARAAIAKLEEEHATGGFGKR